jgi:prepilin-type N-terminal cleavage/methylation domain-containing protein
MYHKIKNRVGVNESGFTLAELSIASAVFSIVLLVALAGFLQIGHIFYKGVTVTSTQETANQIYQDISGYFQTASEISPKLASPVNGYYYYCIGGARFTYNIDKVVNEGANPDHSAAGNFGILKDILPGGSACAAPCNDLPGPGPGPQPSQPCNGIRFQNPQELLGDKMRVLKFDICPGSCAAPTSSNLYNISMLLAYGDDEVLGTQTPGDPTTRYCLGGSVNQQFCSFATIDAGIFKGFQ